MVLIRRPYTYILKACKYMRSTRHESQVTTARNGKRVADFDTILVSDISSPHCCCLSFRHGSGITNCTSFNLLFCQTEQ